MLPISKLKSNFLKTQIDNTASAIESDEVGGRVAAIICDGNRVNQKFFKLHQTMNGKPWLSVDGTFLLFDYVHLFKNIRNLWITEKMQELKYMDNGCERIAKWAHIAELFNVEHGDSPFLRLSTLDYVSVFPRPIERQKVSTVLKVFSEKTIAALRLHSKVGGLDGAEDTAIFMEKVLKWWKILNVKSPFMDERSLDSNVAPICDPNDSRLQYILDFGKMALDMAGKQGSRVKQLSRDTSNAIYNTCQGIVELCKYLLGSTHEYVLLGTFSTDPLEKEFGKLRQGSGGASFINVQNCIEKLRINKCMLLITLKKSINEIILEDEAHHCPSCSYHLCEKGCLTVASLPDLEDSLSSENKMALVYIAGYVTRKDGELSEEELLGQTNYYFQRYGDYVKSLDKGGLNIPSDIACQWAIFSYIIFDSVKDNVCRHSLTNILLYVSEFFEFEMQRQHCVILTNILLKNNCIVSTPLSTKEGALKCIKLSLDF